MDKNVYISMLLEKYGKLLTTKQFNIIDLYYNQNLSLGEIAEEQNITRQGVRKVLVDAEKKLIEIEEKLGILAEKAEEIKLINEIIKQVEDEKVINLLKKLL